MRTDACALRVRVGLWEVLGLQNLAWSVRFRHNLLLLGKPGWAGSRKPTSIGKAGVGKADSVHASRKAQQLSGGSVKGGATSGFESRPSETVCRFDPCTPRLAESVTGALSALRGRERPMGESPYLR